ncbi:hypothetical protein ES703_107128 [subsurface metagenome]
MAAKAFVLIETVAGKSNLVVAAIRQLGEERIKSVDLVTGPYDVIAVLEEETLPEIGDLVTDKINSIAGISRVVACLAI